MNGHAERLATIGNAMAATAEAAAYVQPTGHRPHEFAGREDRPCEQCGTPDRNPIHTRPPAPTAADLATPDRYTTLTDIYTDDPDDIETLTQGAIQQWREAVAAEGYTGVGHITATVTDRYVFLGNPAKATIRVTGLCAPSQDPTRQDRP